MTKLNPKLEALAIELAAVPFDGLTKAEIDEKISALTDALDDDDVGAVIARAAAINRAEAQQYEAEADALESLQRLMQASGCPQGKGAFVWLIERGLIVETEDGYRIVAPGPTAA